MRALAISEKFEFLTLFIPPPPQALMTKPFHKPFEATYKANRPIEDPIARAADHFRPPKSRKTGEGGNQVLSPIK